MLQETEYQCLEREKFKKGHGKGINNSRFSLLVDEEIDIFFMRGRSYKSHGRGKHRTLVKGAFALHNLRNGGWRY